MNSVFLDTDVVLDLYVEREPHHKVALQLLTRIKRTKTRCFTSPVVVANAYYLLAKIRNARYAIDKMRRFRRLVAIAPLNESIIDAALASPYRDFEDSIQFQCAVQNGIKTLITRNTKDYPKERLRIADPGQYMSASVREKNRE